MGPLGKSHVGLQSVLQEESEKVPDELEGLPLLLVPGQ